MHVGQVSGVWASATTSIAPPTPGLANFAPAPALAPLSGSSPFAALSASAQAALLRAQEQGHTSGH